MEWQFYPGQHRAPVATFEFHQDRDRAPHCEMSGHRPRMDKAASFVNRAIEQIVNPYEMVHPDHYVNPVTISDLGCGDGGLLQLINDVAQPWRAGDIWIHAYGYDFHPASQAGWKDRAVEAYPLNVFDERDDDGNSYVVNPGVQLGNIVVMTEVLEHLTAPHAVVDAIGGNPGVKYVVASSPHTEHSGSHDECHAWAWDVQGYRTLFENRGYEIVQHEEVGMFQVILARTLGEQNRRMIAQTPRA